MPGHGLKLGYYAQEHETLDLELSVLENMRRNSPHLDDTAVRNVLGSFLFSGDDVHKPAGVLSGGEKTRLALATLVVSSANVLLLDEPTNNLDPASREEILSAIRRYEGAIILVTHDEGASRPSTPTGSCCCPTATRTCGTTATSTSSASPEASARAEPLLEDLVLVGFVASVGAGAASRPRP